jgi:hypothetical protein
MGYVLNVETQKQTRRLGVVQIVFGYTGVPSVPPRGLRHENPLLSFAHAVRDPRTQVPHIVKNAK